MKMKSMCTLCRLLTALAIATFFAQPALAQQLPRSVTIGTNPPGTVFYALAGGIAKVVTEGGPIPATLQTHSGSSTLLPLINGGELDFAVVNGVDLGMAYAGPQQIKVGGKNDFAHSPDIRLVMRGAPLVIGLLVKKDSPLKSVYDVKGKRVTGEYPAHQAVWFNMFGLLASGGLSWKDVSVVPVPAVNDGIDALVQGRADVSMHAIGSAKLKEADAIVGVRNIALDCSQEGRDRVNRAIPGWSLLTLKAGAFHTIVEDTCVYAYDIYVVASKKTPDAVVEAALKAVWENFDKLTPIHPNFKEWTRERAVHPSVTLPYHPGAIQFYKQREVWKPEMDEVQRNLLALNP